MLGRIKARYKAIWLRAMLPGFELYEDDHRQVAEDAFDAVWFSQWYPLYFCVPVTLVYGGAYALLGLLARSLLGGRSLNWPMIVMGAPAAIILLLGVVVALDLLFMLAIRPRLQRAIRQAIRRRGHEVCLGCGYFLRGVPTGTTRCPECGAARRRPA